MRGADVNYVNKITGLTPLHQAIEAKLNSKIVNFLIKAGGNPHMEDYAGKDCCDKAQNVERYEKLRALTCMECQKDPSMRIKAGSIRNPEIIKDAYSPRKNLNRNKFERRPSQIAG